MKTSKPNARTVLLLVGAVIIIGGAWIAGPKMYTSVNRLLPEAVQSSVSSNDSELMRRIGELQTTVSQLRSRNRQLRVAGSEPLATTTLPTEHITASVLARPPRTPYDVLLVNTGRVDGISVGAAVWWPPGVYLGEIAEVRAGTSLVQLVTSPGVRHRARLDNRLTMTVTGRGGGSMEASVPATTTATNTMVISDRFGAPIGRVVDSQSAPTFARRTLFIQPIVPASVIERVYVQQ